MYRISHVQTATAIEHFGSVKKLADVLGITISAVCQWGARVPEGRAYQIEIRSHRKLKVNPKDYTYDVPRKYPKHGAHV